MTSSFFKDLYYIFIYVYQPNTLFNLYTHPNKLIQLILGCSLVMTGNYTPTCVMPIKATHEHTPLRGSRGKLSTCSQFSLNTADASPTPSFHLSHCIQWRPILCSGMASILAKHAKNSLDPDKINVF